MFTPPRVVCALVTAGLEIKQITNSKNARFLKALFLKLFKNTLGAAEQLVGLKLLLESTELILDLDISVSQFDNFGKK
ncbi:MAG: hypothetical protein ACKVQB_04465 [Bacteroidia bacterium]